MSPNIFAQIAACAGGTYSRWQDEATSYRGGFYAGAQYIIKPDSSLFYFDAGALLLNRGVCLDGTKNEYNFRTSLYFLHIPVDLGYEILCNGNKITLVPQVGLYADLGLIGKVSESAYKVNKFDGLDPFRELADKEIQGIKNFSRYDFGLRAGMLAYLSNKIFLSFAYEYGLLKVFRPTSDVFNSKFTSFQLGLGYVFDKKLKKSVSKPVEI